MRIGNGLGSHAPPEDAWQLARRFAARQHRHAAGGGELLRARPECLRVHELDGRRRRIVRSLRARNPGTLAPRSRERPDDILEFTPGDVTWPEQDSSIPCKCDDRRLETHLAVASVEDERDPVA
ncbi:MAG: hypothetical protein AMJ58_08025 [Gammaproteobacteria bacterium SG8_30]|nr:MAG: hypothetical protein AMJ58_08025 [Gammaproteobacteria bacterium SG8_30]